MTDEIATYKGKLLENMTKEELIVALKHIGKLYQEKLKDNINRK